MTSQRKRDSLADVIGLMADFPATPTTDILELFFNDDVVYLEKCIQLSTKIHAHSVTHKPVTDDESDDPLFDSLELTFELAQGPTVTASQSSWKGLYLY